MEDIRTTRKLSKEFIKDLNAGKGFNFKTKTGFIYAIEGCPAMKLIDDVPYIFDKEKNLWIRIFELKGGKKI